MNEEEPRTSSRRWVWLEEYDRCGCTNITELKRDAMGYCPKHGTDQKRLTRLLNKKTNRLELSHAGVN